MKGIKSGFSVIALTVLLSACGSGGSGSGVSSSSGSSGTGTGGTTTPIVTNSTFQGAKNIGGGSAGTATYNAAAGKYTYNFNGTEIDVTSKGITAGTVVDMTVGSNKQMLGGTTYSYSRFGAIGPVGNLDAGDVFYVGKETASAAMPTTGSAVYKGQAIGLDSDENNQYTFVNVPLTMNVDFGAKVISGNAGNITFNPGQIAGSGFSGSLVGSGEYAQTGSYQGAFFGPSAEELGGLGKLNPDVDGNDDFSFSFGAKRQ